MRVSGRVIKGSGTATSVYGVPTANLASEQPITLHPGVYAATTFLEQRAYPSVVCYQQGGEQCIFEVHLLDWMGNLYDQVLSVEIHESLSEIEPFEDEKQMKQKIHADLEHARYVFRNHSTHR